MGTRFKKMKYTQSDKADARLTSQNTLPQTSVTISPTDLTPVFFHKEYEPPYGFLSQWFLSPFDDFGLDTTYNCAEQRMMHQKALLFQNTASASAILAASEPGKQKALGRTIKKLEGQRMGSGEV